MKKQAAEPIGFTEAKKRRTYSFEVSADPLTQDRLKWVQACLAQVMPEVKTPSNSTIVRRAIENYVSYLENVFATGKLHHANVRGEMAHLMVANQHNGVYWSDGIFPEGQVINEDGTVKRFGLMVKDAQLEHQRATLDKVLKHGH